MAKKISHVAFVSAVLISACLKASVADWTSDLTPNINQQARQYTENLQEEIQHGRVIQSVTGNNSINSENNSTRTVVSGYTADGEPYVRNVEEREDGKYLYHDETIYNLITKSNKTISWRLDLATPGAKPEILTDTN